MVEKGSPRIRRKEVLEAGTSGTTWKQETLD
jgi:hypothetical protein